MPVGNFRWLVKKEIKQTIWETMSDNQDTGYILEVDLDYPEDLHESHNSFPLAPEQLTITEKMLSPYAKGKMLLSVGFEPTNFLEYQILCLTP